MHCEQCGLPFESNSVLLARISPTLTGKTYQIPASSFCPSCRKQQRLAFRNERSLYQRTCSKTGNSIISIYSPDKPYTVYAQPVWWSDEFEPRDYGRAFDFSRPFFEQYAELDLAVPKLAVLNAKSENCDYTNYSCENKNCYLLVGGLGAEDCYYGYRIFYCRDVVDSYDLYRCELCYECSQSTELFDCRHCRNCHSSSNLLLCEDCVGCHNCLGCVNLRQKNYCFFNEQVSAEAYKEHMAELGANLQQASQQFSAFRRTQPYRAQYQINCEAAAGDFLLHCKRCNDAFVLKNSEDCSFASHGENNRDCQDCNYFDNSELQYFCTNLEKNYRAAFGALVWYTSDSYYVTSCFNSNHLFGCSGMKKHAFCVLNKEYPPAEYEHLVARIIEHMKHTGEWGRYFPAAVAPFSYNESTAADYFPLSRDEALRRGYSWKETPRAAAEGEAYRVPSSINEVSDEIVKAALCCNSCGKNYRVVQQELRFYRKMDAAVPSRCPNCRHLARMESTNPHQLWQRSCARCSNTVLSSYSPQRAAAVYCGSCYEKYAL